MNRINILDAIEEYKNYHSSIILSYGANLPFYESAILRRLWKTNSRTNLVFMDAHRYQDTIHHFRDAIGYVGKRYLVVPVNIGTYQAFHPKLILLLGADRARLIIGSGNVTFNGYGDNLEIFTMFDWSENHPQNLNIFTSTWKFINKIQEEWGYSEQAKRMLQKAEYQSQWLQNNLDNSNPALISSSTSSLINQIKIILDGKVVNKITIISPFLDEQARGIKSLYSEFNPSQIDLLLQPDRSVVNIQSIRVLIDEGISVNLYQILEECRYVHAKVYFIETTEEVLLFSGSANCTQSGLLSDISTGNYELLTYRKFTSKEEAYHFLHSGFRCKPITNLEDNSFKERIEFKKNPPTFIDLLDAFVEGDRLTIKFSMIDIPDYVGEIELRSDFPKEIRLSITEFTNGINEYSLRLGEDILPLVVGVFSVYIQGISGSKEMQNIRSNSLWVTNLTELNKRMIFLTPEDEESARLLREKLLSDDQKWESLYRSIVELVELEVGRIRKVSKSTSKVKPTGENKEEEKESTLLVIDEFTEREERLAEIESELIGESRISSWLRIVFGMFPQDGNSTSPLKEAEVVKSKLQKPSKNIGNRFVLLVRRFIRVLDNVEFMQSMPTFFLLAYFSTFQRINWILFTSKVLNEREYIDYSLSIFHGYFGIISDRSSPFSLPTVQNFLNLRYLSQWQETQAHLHAILNLYILQDAISTNEVEKERLDSCLIHLLSCLVCIFPPDKLIEELHDLDQLADFFNYEPVKLFFNLKETVENLMPSVIDTINEWVIHSDTVLSTDVSLVDPDIFFSTKVSLVLGDLWAKQFLQKEEDIWGWTGLIQWCTAMDYAIHDGRYLQKLVNVLQSQDLDLNLDEVFFELAKKGISEERYKDALELIDKVLLLSERDEDSPFMKSVMVYRNMAVFLCSETNGI